MKQRWRDKLWHLLHPPRFPVRCPDCEWWTSPVTYYQRKWKRVQAQHNLGCPERRGNGA